MTPSVTVIVTVYKRLNYLARALESVFTQTFDDYEIVIADDSGTAAAREIARSFVSRGRTRYEANSRTLGIALSLQSALRKARGRYVAILNDDDLWEREFLAHLVPPLEGDDRRVLAFCDHWIVRESGDIDRGATDRNTKAYGRHHLPAGDVTDPHGLVLLKNAVPLAMGAVFRAGAFDYAKLVADVAGAYDFWISCLLAGSGGGLYYVPERLTRYRLHNQMETARRSPDKSECFVYIWRSLAESGMFPEVEDHLRSRLAESTVRAGRDRLYFNQIIEARSLFRYAFHTAPGWAACASYLLTMVPLQIRKATGVSQS